MDEIDDECYRVNKIWEMVCSVNFRFLHECK